MNKCAECGGDLDGQGGASLCDGCALTNVVELFGDRGDAVDEWATCPLCDGSGRCFYCSPGGPCYHCSGSGREMPGSEAECHICSGSGQVGKGCAMCDFSRRCRHCGGTGRIPADVLAKG